MTLIFQSILFGLTVTGIVVGLLGTIVPVLPGPLIIFLSIMGYGYANEWQQPSAWMTIGLLLITGITGSADIWLPYLGVGKASGARRAGVYGFIGGIIGMFFGFILGSIIGYALGVLLGTYQKHRDFRKALKASFVGVAGQGTATLVQLSGGVLVLYLFVRVVLDLG